ncbi:MAG: phenylalanyl-tRNA synthetase alpha chain [Parcubacteria group bacterium Licking1014_17]|nr:MAG: phenylalanyl-tRNA synthetase alpha chain [Parcubacteria group bacterium Licking1014_17]
MDKETLNKIEKAAQSEISAAKTLSEFESLRVKYLGRKSELSEFLSNIKNLPEAERAKAGQIANETRRNLQKMMDDKRAELGKIEIKKKLSSEKIDITAPGVKFQLGHRHPLTIVRDQVEDVFSSMGFAILDSREIESEWYNFDSLNMPDDHPARDMQDTFWLEQSVTALKDHRKHLVLRTQTTAHDVRFLEKHEPPFRILIPGRVFRNEATDFTHEMQFYQFDSLMVDRHISLANLKGIVVHFFRQFFKEDIEVKFVSSYFPFTEPSVEIQIKGKRGALRGRWIEVAGAGMLHQNVFKAAGYTPREWQGFAFGMCIDRLVMLKYKIDDIRLLYGSDIRFLEQF